jgi:hypothetical protein
MSLLGTPVYANPTTPLWLSSAGGTISGNLTVGPPGFITGGRIAASKAINPTFGNFALSDASGITQGGLNQITGVGVTDVNLQCTSGRSTFFGLVGSSNANSSITPSVFGANTDLLRINGTTRTNVMDSPDVSGNRAIRLTGGAAGIGYIQGSTIRFTQLDATTGNTALVTSVAGSNADTFTVGGTVSALGLKLSASGPAAACGSSAVPVGATNIVISNTAVQSNSIILVSHSGAAAAGPGNGAAQGGLTANPALIVPGVSFRVDLVNPSTGVTVAASVVDSEFNYLIINPA